MIKKTMITLCVFVSIFLVNCTMCAAEKVIDLPHPELTKGKPLMQTLSLRRTTREFSDVEISDQVLANILWAANGVNRLESGGRTSPSSWGSKEIDIYVARRDGLFFYNPEENVLVQKLGTDIRQFTGEQEFHQKTPANLIYVANYDKFNKMIGKGDDDFYAATDTGFVSQNVYLYCASEGLATVVVGWVDKKRLHEKMGLGENEKVILTQPVGYPLE